jgi:hypothetical protein
MVSIKVIPDIGFNFGSPINELLKVWTEIETKKKQQLLVDLSGCRFSNPFFLLGLYLLYRHCKSEGYDIELNIDCKNEYFLAYLNLTYFRGGFKPDDQPIGEYNTVLDSYRYKTYLPLTNFPSGDDASSTNVREKVLELMGQRLRERLQLDAQLFSAVSFIIAEAVNNIKDHSRTDRGYLFTQFYPKRGFLDLCIADTGVSIFGSYKAVGRKDITSHEQAVQAALSGDSTKDDPSRGFGIRTSRKMLVSGLGGRYFLLSGNAFLFSYPGATEAIKVLPPEPGISWPGTYLALRIPIQKNVKFQISDYLEP